MLLKLCLPLVKGFPSVKPKCYGPLVPSLMMGKCWSRSLLVLFTIKNQTQPANQKKKEVVGKPVSGSAAQQTRNYMITVGTDPEYGTLDSDGPIIQVPGQNRCGEIRDCPNGDRSRILTRRKMIISTRL